VGQPPLARQAVQFNAEKTAYQETFPTDR